MAARFITAPDKIPAEAEDCVKSKVLILDSEWHDIESLAILCMTRNIDADFYLYGPTSIDGKWLSQAANESDVILVNNNSDRHLELKEKVNKESKALSIGTENDEFKVPLDYIVKQLGEQRKRQ